MLQLKKLHDAPKASSDLECDQFANKDYLMMKDLDGARGQFQNYQEYCDTVSALNACLAGNTEKFKELFVKLGRSADDKVTVTYSSEPRNPYSWMQTRDGSVSKSFLELANAYRQEACAEFLQTHSASMQEKSSDKPKPSI